MPRDKLIAHFARTLVDLKAAIREFPRVLIFDNNDLRTPFRQVAAFANGQRVSLKAEVPKWLKPILP